MAFELMTLPFDKKGLEPVISAETLDYHHGKHHAAYVKKVNDLTDGKAELAEASIVEIVRHAHSGKDKALFNNAAQIFNHNFYWHSLSPVEDAGEPSQRLAKLIEDGFGTPAGLLKAMQDEAVGHFSNGWVWLYLDGDKLSVTSLHDADTPIVHDGAVPLFTLDVWEHAYYIDYRNARPDYAKSTLESLVNWNFVSDNLDGNGIQRADQPAA